MRPSPRAFRLLAAMALACSAGAVSAQATGAAAPVALAAAPTEAAHERAIFAVTDADPMKWNLTLANIGNAIDGLGAGADVELVAYGPGIAMLKKDSAVAARLADAIKGGPRVAACNNSMHAFHIEPADLVAGAGVVPSGVVELIRRQHAGYAYVRS